MGVEALMEIDDVLAGRAKWCVIHGDVRDVLKALDAEGDDVPTK
jgi:hypothetical protein